MSNNKLDKIIQEIDSEIDQEKAYFGIDSDEDFYRIFANKDGLVSYAKYFLDAASKLNRNQRVNLLEQDHKGRMNIEQDDWFPIEIIKADSRKEGESILNKDRIDSGLLRRYAEYFFAICVLISFLYLCGLFANFLNEGFWYLFEQISSFI